MKSFSFICFIVLSVIVGITMAENQPSEELSLEEEWSNFKTKFNKAYETAEEEARRLKIFEENLLKVREHNKKYETGESTYKQGINAFADLTPEEFSRTRLGLRRPEPEETEKSS